MRHALILTLFFWFPCQAEESCEAVSDTERPTALRLSELHGDVPFNTPGGLGDEAGLITFHLATDGRRWQVSHVLPDRISGEMQMVGEHISEGVLSRFRRADEEMLLVLRSLQGSTKTYVAALGQPWRYLGPVEDTKARVTCVSNIRRTAQGDRLIALGHRGGKVSLWQFQGVSPWKEISQMKVSHHEWESVTLVTMSEDGRLLLAASQDNVMLYYLSDEAVELQHLHGGATQISAACISSLPNGEHFVVIAYQRGGLEGWTVEGLDVMVAWNIPKDGAVVTNWLDLAPASVTSETPTLMLASGDVNGVVTVWSLTAKGALASPNTGRWSKVASQRVPNQPVAGLRLLHIKPALVGILRYGQQKAHWLLAVASGKDVIVLDALSGQELHHGVAKQPHMVQAMEWR